MNYVPVRVPSILLPGIEPGKNTIVSLIIEHILGMGLSDGETLQKQMENFIGRVRVWCQKRGVAYNPMGAGDAKTGTPGTYRPIINRLGESSCPKTCPFNRISSTKCGMKTAPCYGMSYHCNLNQERASLDVNQSLVSAAIVMATAVKHGTVARNNITGDNCGPDGTLDLAYLEGLAEVATAVRAAFNTRDTVMFSYTHIGEARYGPWLTTLAKAGVHIRISDKFGYNGAIVHPHSDFEALKSDFPGLKFAKCPAQLTHNAIQCRRCKMCWATPQVITVFDPHGPGAKTAEERARDMRLAALHGAHSAPCESVAPGHQVLRAAQLEHRTSVGQRS